MSKSFHTYRKYIYQQSKGWPETKYFLLVSKLLNVSLNWTEQSCSWCLYKSWNWKWITRSPFCFCNCWNRKWKFHQDSFCPQRWKVELPILSKLSKSQVVTERQAAREEKARIWFAARYLGNCKQTLGSHFWNKSCDQKLSLFGLCREYSFWVALSWLKRKALLCLTALYLGTSGGIPPPANRRLNATIRNI